MLFVTTENESSLADIANAAGNTCIAVGEAGENLAPVQVIAGDLENRGVVQDLVAPGHLSRVGAIVEPLGGSYQQRLVRGGQNDLDIGLIPVEVAVIPKPDGAVREQLHAAVSLIQVEEARVPNGYVVCEEDLLGGLECQLRPAGLVGDR